MAGRPGPMPMRSAPDRGSTARGCGIAAVIVGVVVGGLVLLGLVAALVMDNQGGGSDSDGLGRTAPVAATHSPGNAVAARTRAEA
jgi:hypothetical protein